MGLIKEIALFAGGTLFGSAGFKLLTSRDAKKAYVHATAAGLRVKDSVMATVEEVQENADDILASAKDLNLEREMREKKLPQLKRKQLKPKKCKMTPTNKYDHPSSAVSRCTESRRNGSFFIGISEE